MSAYMYRYWCLIFFMLMACEAFAQVSQYSPTSDVPEVHIRQNQHTRGVHTDSALFDASLAPFYHGVASGDPTEEGVWLWTRVTPEAQQDSAIAVSWRIGTDTALMDIVAQGIVSTDSSRDYTVKVEVTGLDADTYYYYEFSALEKNALRGRTKTAPSGAVDHLRFGVVSCSNYEAGYFNAYARLAERNDLDAILHLGDYIYEYGTRVFGDSTIPRSVNSGETLTLAEYRARYSLYRLDPDLRRIHQQHPFIMIWDDHETANDSWTGGAQNHDPATEGNWENRKSAGKKAYFEWQAIPDPTDSSIYRKLSYGDLADLLMLDTRLEGREEQILDVTAPALYDSSRTLLGTSQRDWFVQGLETSEATWKIVGNQVMFSIFHIGFTAAFDPDITPNQLESIFLDIWDGYPAERQRIVQAIESAGVDNVVFLTGDFHCSFGFEVADPVNDPTFNFAPVPTYDPETGEGAVAVEFVTPSVNSSNFDERLGLTESNLLESLINAPLPFPFPPNRPNPHMKYVDLDRHGYMILDLKPDTAQANWYYVSRIDTISEVESFGQGYYVLRDTHQLVATNLESKGKNLQAIPAPASPRDTVITTVGIDRQPSAVVLSLYPNPVRETLYLQLGLSQPSDLKLFLRDLQGRMVIEMPKAQRAFGVMDITWELGGVPAGVYLLSIQTETEQISRRIVIP